MSSTALLILATAAVLLQSMPFPSASLAALDSRRRFRLCRDSAALGTLAPYPAPPEWRRTIVNTPFTPARSFGERGRQGEHLVLKDYAQPADWKLQAQAKAKAAPISPGEIKKRCSRT